MVSRRDWGAEEPAMRSILFGIVALLVLIVVSALSALILVAPNSAGPGLQVLLPSARAQGVGKSQGHVPQAPVGHRQPTAQGAENVRENSSASDAMRKIDENLKKKLQGICRGC
jgi:hypothetical protein